MKRPRADDWRSRAEESILYVRAWYPIYQTWPLIVRREETVVPGLHGLIPTTAAVNDNQA